jgi:hypothetical protein
MSESKDYLEMSFRSIECFSNDGKLDANELGKILDIAETDGKIDQNEMRVLRNIISKIRPSELDDAMRSKIEEITNKINAKKMSNIG